MNKQEAIETIKAEWFSEVGTNLQDIIDIVNMIDEPQKVAIPKFVAEWLKKYRHAHTLLKVLNSAEDERIMPSTVNDWILDNQYDFIKAWMDGYEEETDE